MKYKILWLCSQKQALSGLERWLSGECTLIVIFLKKVYFYFIHECLPECTCVCHAHEHLWRSEGVGPPGPGATDRHATTWVLGAEPESPASTVRLCSAELLLQPLVWVYVPEIAWELVSLHFRLLGFFPQLLESLGILREAAAEAPHLTRDIWGTIFYHP